MPIPVSNGGVLDVASVVSQLMAIERRPLNALAQREARAQADISYWGQVKGSLSGLQAAVRGLDSLEKFRALSASVADTAVAGASASGKAAPGSYSIEVLGLAQAQKLRSNPVASGSTVIGTGTLTFQFGTYDSGSNGFTLDASRAATTVTVASGQNTLAGIRDAVNAADTGVTASIINDGAGSRLVFSSEKTGTASSLKITVTDGDATNTDASGLSQLAWDPTATAGSGKNLVQTAAAADASLKIDGITVTSATNTVADAVDGVTLTLAKTNIGTPTTLTVARDAGAGKKAIESFIATYNGVAKTLRDLTGFNAETRQGGPLQGDAAARDITTRMRAVLSGALEALQGSFTTLSDVGISFQKDGTLALDAKKLQSAVDAGFEDVAGVFTRRATATDSRVSYKSATASTIAGTYAVSLTQPATRGTLAGAAPAGLVITAGVNDSLAFTVDGATATVTLGAGTYASATALAAEVQTRINGATAFAGAGIAVEVSQAAGVLTLTSKRYGGGSNVTVATGAAADSLLGAGRTAATGLDIAGTIAGVAATGSGRSLTGASGSGSHGLALDIDATSAGSLGTVTYTIGYATKLDRLIDGMLDAKGPLAGKTAGLDAQVKDIGRRRTALTDRLDSIELRYRRQYTALDTLLSRMNSTSQFLTSQLAALPGSGSGSGR